MIKRDREPSGRVRQALRLSLCVLSAAGLGACGGSDNVPNLKANATAAVAGTITYDYVPTAVTVEANGEAKGRLDYPKTVRRPVRRALVELVSADGATILGKTATDDTGAYSIAIPAGKRAYVRVTAKASEGSATAPDYSIGIRDNTAPEYKVAAATAPLYSMRGSVFTTASAVTKLDLNAGSGWTGANYGAPRTAAPFAMLDQMVTAAQKLHRVEPGVLLPALNVFWSVNNRPTSGDANKGFITTCYYDPAPATRGLYLLGAENVDTSEYNPSVIIHEYGHYLEANVSRSDAIGGEHGIGRDDALDMRVAFGEGFGTAFSSMIRETPVYTEVYGPKQALMRLYMRLDEVQAGDSHTWFGESAVGNFLYSVSQSPDIGFAPLYRAMLTGEKTTPALTSAFSFATALRPALTDAGKRALDQALVAINVQPGDQLDAWGSQTKFKGDPADDNLAVFPVYLPLTSGQTVKACMTTQFGGSNKLGNYRHLRVTVPAAGRYRFTAAPDANDRGVNDYSFAAFAQGKALSNMATTGQGIFDFPAAGDYAVDVYSEQDVVENAVVGTAPHCVSASMQQINP